MCQFSPDGKLTHVRKVLMSVHAICRREFHRHGGFIVVDYKRAVLVVFLLRYRVASSARGFRPFDGRPDINVDDIRFVFVMLGLRAMMQFPSFSP